MAVTSDDFTHTAKTAIYTRIMFDDCEAILEQERKLLEYAFDNGYENCVSYRDNGKNGITLNNPEMQEMIADVKSGAIDTVIVQSLDRLTSNYWLLDELVSMLTNHDVSLISIADGGVVNGVE
jgi:DNA invertase Pin-like site-specific DNA recombinase